MIYLDHAATTPLDPRVRDAMHAVSDELQSAQAANASSVHAAGRRAAALLRNARHRVADLIGADPHEIIFTASGSEANNLAIKGSAFAHANQPFHLIVSSIEHDSVLNAALWLGSRFPWIKLTQIEPDEGGLIASQSAEAVLEQSSSMHAVVAIMGYNNETGVRQPVEEICEIARGRGVMSHVDGVQWVGRESLDVSQIGCDTFSLSAHKFNGPAGAGLLWIRRGTKIAPLVHGGHQELEFRAGTENIAAAVGMARALEIAYVELDEHRRQMQLLETIFIKKLEESGACFTINGNERLRGPGLLNISFPGAKSHDLVVGMDLAGFAISAGSACSSGVIESSRVLTNMCLPTDRVESAVRISFGRGNRPEVASSAAEVLAGLQARLSESDISE